VAPEPHGCGKAAQQCGEPRGIARHLGVCPLDGVVQRRTGEYQIAQCRRLRHGQPRIGFGVLTAFQLEAPARNGGAEPVARDVQLAAQRQLTRQCRIEGRVQGEQQRVDAQFRRAVLGQRCAAAPVGERAEHGLQFLPALGEFIHGGGRRRSQAPSPHQAVGFELAQPLREDVLAHLRQPAVQVGVAVRAEDQLLALEVSTSTVCRSVLTPPGPGGHPSVGGS
jgi:hypothetical protein